MKKLTKDHLIDGQVYSKGTEYEIIKEAQLSKIISKKKSRHKVKEEEVSTRARKWALLDFLKNDYVIKSADVKLSAGPGGYNQPGLDDEFKTPAGKYLVLTNEEATRRSGISDIGVEEGDWSYTRRGKKLATYDGREYLGVALDQTLFIYKLDDYDYSDDYE